VQTHLWVALPSGFVTEAVKLAPDLTFVEGVGEPWVLMTVILNVDCAVEVEDEVGIEIEV